VHEHVNDHVGVHAYVYADANEDFAILAITVSVLVDVIAIVSLTCS
jgi:hypothetical protein